MLDKILNCLFERSEKSLLFSLQVSVYNDNLEILSVSGDDQFVLHRFWTTFSSEGFILLYGNFLIFSGLELPQSCCGSSFKPVVMRELYSRESDNLRSGRGGVIQWERNEGDCHKKL